MPEIRLSDYVQQFANTLGQMSQVFGRISADQYEKARVSAVNDNLVMFERSFQDYMDNASKISYEEQMEDNETSSVVPKSFGEAQFYTIDQNYAKFVNDQAEYIRNNVTHKDARQELLWHLQQKSVQERGNLLRIWDQAADAHAKKGLAELYDATMKANISWEEKVGRIENRVVQMVHSGRLSVDQGQIIVQEATDAAQYTYAKGGALEAIREANDLEAGEKWIRENTPFYDQNADAREELIGDVRREWDAIARREDMELDSIYADLHINADTIEMVDGALSKLAMTEFHDGNQKYIWETRFRAKRNSILALLDLPGDAAKWIADAQEDVADKLRAELVIAIAQGKPIDALREIVYETYRGFLINPDTGEPVQASLINSKHVKEFSGMLDAGFDDRIKDGVSYINEMLEGEQKYEAVNTYKKWYAENQTASPEDLYKAALNIVAPIKQRNIADWGNRTAEELFGDKRVLSPAEQLMRDISEGRLQGLTNLRAEDLAVLNSVVLDWAKQQYPTNEIFAVFSDNENDFNTGDGAPILLGADNQVYAFKVEDKQLVLYRLAKHKDGTRAWGKVSTAKELADIAAAEEEEKRRKPYEARIIEAAEKTPAETTKEIAQGVSEIPELGGAFGKQIQKAVEESARVEAEGAERRARLTGESPTGEYDLNDYVRVGEGQWRVKGGALVTREVARILEGLWVESEGK